MVENKKKRVVDGRKNVIAMDMGGTNLRIAIVKNNKILKYYKERTPKTSKEIKSRIFALVEEYMSDKIKGIAIASPGPLKNGTIMNPPNLPLRNYNLKKALQDKFKVPVEVKNDADCVAFAELKLGCKKKNFIILTLGTGIGGGIIIDGKLYRGEGYAGELGRIIIDRGMEFEQLAASKRLRAVTTDAFGEPKLFSELMRMKEKKAKSILEEFGRYYGQGIASLIHCFDPEVVILAGGVRECGDKFLRLIKKYSADYFQLPKKTPIQWSKLDHAGILGATLYFE